MSIVFDSVDIKGLRVVHFEQLLSYLERREYDSWYYGNRKQFEKRHEEIKEWLCKIIEYARSEGVIIPIRRKEGKK